MKAYRDSADFFGDGNQFASHTLGAMPMEQWYVNVLNEVSPDVDMASTLSATRRATRSRGRPAPPGPSRPAARSPRRRAASPRR